MKKFAIGLLGATLGVSSLCAQDTLNVSATPIPDSLLTQNYGKMPKGIGGYDLTICNASSTKQIVISSQIFQALVAQQAGVQPMGKQIMLAAILRNQNSGVLSILNMAVGSASGVLSVLSSTHNIPSSAITATSLSSLALQQLFNNLKPYTSATALQQFDNQVLETALALDSGSCVERTIFTLLANSKVKPLPLSFRVH
jgi:hypothetical protein